MKVLGRNTLAAALVAALAPAATAAWSPALASDHQDTPEVEINPRCDINDVYAFPSSADPSRICLIMTTSSPLTPGASANASFDPDKLYQIKIDNTGDAVEDLVFQFTFDGSGSTQDVTVRGPVAPVTTGKANKLIPTDSKLAGKINTILGSASAVQAFCGVKDDPFFIDLEQFFRLVPDRRPSRGALSAFNPIDPPSWRDPAPDYVAGYNCLAIAVELPEALLTGTRANGEIGVWGTISR
jgi:hypothetical protein